MVVVVSSSRCAHPRAMWTLLVPTAAVALWALYLRLQISSDGGAGEMQEIGLPFVGFFQALTNYWIGNTMDFVIGIAMLLILILFGYRAVVRRPGLVHSRVSPCLAFA